jgi:zinc D-Ala-D-Ala carboxypeptidase
MITSMPGGVAAVTERIHAIEQRFGRHPDVAAPAAVGAPGPEVGQSFDPFGAAYERALAGVSTAGRLTETNRAPAATGSTGGYGAMPVPPALAPYGNGRIPADVLTPIAQSGHRLYAPAAAAWDRVVAAAAQDGISLRITDSYRSYEQQVDLAARKGLYRDGGLAAVPGTSNHGWGLAVDADVTDPATLEWLRRNGPRFGYVETVPREPWHWEFRPHQV